MNTWVRSSGAHQTNLARTSYTTTFPLTQNPINENGAWINGTIFTAGFRTNMQTGSGNGYGTMTSHGAHFEDSAAYLTNWQGNNQQVVVTLFNDGTFTSGSNTVESEILLRVSGGPNNLTAYEVDCYLGGSRIDVIRWDGFPDNPDHFLQLVTPGPTVAFGNGDQVRAAISGDILTVDYKPFGGSFSNIITVNVRTVGTNTDGIVYATGAPGMGGWNETGTANACQHFCWSDFSAVAL